MIVLFIFFITTTVAAIITTRFSAPSAVGQCAEKNVHKESLTLTWSVNYLGFLLQMLVLGFGSIWEGFKGCKKKLNPLFSKTAK